MNDHIPGPNFTKSSTASRKDASEKEKQYKATKLQCVRLEMQEKEAIMLLRRLCEEGYQTLGITNDIEFSDVLTGLLLLANIYKRIGNAKTSTDECMKQLKNEHNINESELHKKVWCWIYGIHALLC
jgi:hypothetical protein